MNDLKLWYDKPANTWCEALPLGNGRLGAMIFGGTLSDKIQMNEDSVWYGGFVDRNNPDAPANLSEVRSLIKQGRIPEAERLALTALSGTPESQKQYQPLGDIIINYYDYKNKHENYERSLDLTEAISYVKYTMGNVNFKREAFISEVDQVMVVKYTANQSGKISFRATLERDRFYEKTYKSGNDTIILNASCGKNGVELHFALRAIVEGGSVKTVGDHIVVENADSVTLLSTAATTFRYEDTEKTSLDWLNSASQLGFEKLKVRHIADYQNLFKRVEIDLEDTNSELYKIPTDQRLARVKEGKDDAGLVSLIFQYGRYLLISCSRPNTLPANLQGIWNDSFTPPWDSKYTININTEMNYWLAETCNLSELHQPIFEHLERMLENGRHTAKFMYNSRGFVVHHNTDIWGDTAPQDLWLAATHWTMGAAWLCTHIWEHYLFTQDIEFLKKYYYLLKESALFFLDHMTENNNGQLVVFPTLSPENKYLLDDGYAACLCEGCSMDSQILTTLFSANIMASRILGVDEELLTQFETALDKLPKIQLGKFGQIMEWLEDYDEALPGHRHISHLYGLYPGNQITVLNTPELAQGARKTLQRRLENGGAHTGWSRAWVINCWARLQDEEQVYYNIMAILKNSTEANLFNSHPPFQIDGNFGLTAGIAEMLMQSHDGRITLLAALPKNLSSGSVKGLIARAGFEVNMSWNNMKIQSAEIKSLLGNVCRIKTIEDKTIFCDGVKVEKKYLPEIDAWEFETIIEKIYTIGNCEKG